jgi:pyruvate formate lyase activating enzyme
MELLLMDAPFYRVSGGGVTLSGGEPTLHMEYAGEVLRRLHESAVHTAIETNGLFAWDRFRDIILPYIDLIMMDVKLVDPLKHGTHTGASDAANELIIENLRRLVREYPSRLLPRVPLIPEFTATADNLGDIAELFRSLGITRYALLPYNPTWFHKAAAIGRPIDPRLSTRMLTRDEVSACRACFADRRLSASAPHEKGMHTTNGATYNTDSQSR